MNLSGKHLNFAVIGDPIAHSLSPVMQNAGLRALGINGQYTAVRVKKEELADFVKAARYKYRGFNITVPHKQAVIPFLDDLSEECCQTESVNTVLNDNGRLKGFSTDGYGLATALQEEFNIDIAGQTFAFIGAGGAVRAVAPYFANLGAASLFFINRTLARAKELCTVITARRPNVHTGCCSPSDRDTVRAFFTRAAVIIQGTSLGLKPDDPPPVDPGLLPSGHCFYETIYKPTPILCRAGQQGLKTADGRGMLLHQGVKSLAIWTGRKPEISAMRRALYEAIDG